MLTALYLLAAVVGVTAGLVIFLCIRVKELERQLSDRHYGVPVVKMPSPEVRDLIDKMIKRNRGEEKR